jgi:hypothetical protein
VGRESFEEIAGSTLEGISAEQRAEHIYADFVVLVDFLQQATGDGEVALDRHLLIRMLKERGQKGIEAFLDKPQFRNKGRWELEEIRFLLSELSRSSPDPDLPEGEDVGIEEAVLQAEERPDESATTEVSGELREGDGAPNVGSSPSGMITLVESDEESQGEVSAPAVEVSGSNGQEAISSDKMPSGPAPASRQRYPEDPMSVTMLVHREDIEAQPPGPYLPLEQLMGRKDRRLILKKVFQKNEAAFEQFVARINELDRWKEAKVLIDQELEDRGVRPFSNEATRLGDIVFQRYFKR